MSHEQRSGPQEAWQRVIHVHQAFRPVGHGTFFTGVVRPGDEGLPSFSWVYDCGSKRTTRVAGEIDLVDTSGLLPPTVDLLALSHFDDDHINGVEQLLRARPVRSLALPYLDLGQRLAQAASIASEPCSASTALFQLDPLSWLASQGLSERVSSVLLIRGGQRGQDDPQDLDPRPLPAPVQSNRNPQDDLGAQGEVETDLQLLLASGSDGTPGPALATWSHLIPVGVPGLPIELMFYNSEQPDLFRRTVAGERVTRRSRVTPSSLQYEIQQTIKHCGLDDLSRTPRRGWRNALRSLYERHFGSTSQARNNISLCLLVRPRTAQHQPCRIFRRWAAVSQHLLPVRLEERAGLLCLGDLRVDGATVDALMLHFGQTRWRSVGIVQVPHHGSRHSWELGNAVKFSPNYFVQCVPDKSDHHPHGEVTRDLAGFSELTANYDTGVSLDYHVY